MSKILYPDGVCNSVKMVAGQVTTASAADQVTVTEMTKIESVVVSMDSDPGDNPFMASATFTGNVITIKTWQNTSGSDPTPTAATTFSKKVNYIVVGI